ncbi:hypothetical protein C0991_009567, partial [Blastosporella zonata]
PGGRDGSWVKLAAAETDGIGIGTGSTDLNIAPGSGLYVITGGTIGAAPRGNGILSGGPFGFG